MNRLFEDAFASGVDLSAMMSQADDAASDAPQPHIADRAAPAVQQINSGSKAVFSNGVDLASLMKQNLGETPGTDDATDGSDTATADTEVDADNDGATDTAAKPDTPKTYPADFDWGAEFKRRVEENKALDPGARQSDYELESVFWTEFYNHGWGEDIAKTLITIDPLKKAIKILGFDPKTNPILAFLKQSYVKKTLLPAKLINVNTYVAIHNAVVKKLIADSELLAAHAYNVLYCKDFYTKPVADMIKYLTIQNSLLPATSSKYTAEAQNRARRILFSNGTPSKDVMTQIKTQSALADDQLPSALDSNTKLNTLEFIEAYKQKAPGRATATDETADTEKKTDDEETPDTEVSPELVSKFTETSDVLAAAQYLSVRTGSKKAAQAIRDQRLASVTTQELADAYVRVSGVLGKLKMSADTADEFIAALLKSL